MGTRLSEERKEEQAKEEAKEETKEEEETKEGEEEEEEEEESSSGEEESSSGEEESSSGETASSSSEEEEDEEEEESAKDGTAIVEEPEEGAAQDGKEPTKEVLLKVEQASEQEELAQQEEPKQAATPKPKSARGRKRKIVATSEDGASQEPGSLSEPRAKKPVYFEWAKKIWESEETFKLPDGTFWPYVIEGSQGEDHGVVICKLCQRHEKTNNFAGDGYRKGKRSALVDHQMKNREHKLLVEAMETTLKRVVLLAGVPQRLIGKVAIITGGAKGIGLACASCLGHEGAKVVVADIDDIAASRAVQQLQLDGVHAAAAKCDVTQRNEVEQLIAWTVDQYGSLDIMVANAGIVKGADFLETTEEDWDDVLNVNLKGPFICGQLAARQMVQQNSEGTAHGGAIINMSSVNAVMAIPTICSYNASKGGLNNLTRCMAVSLAPHNIRVNAIGPGSIMTEVLQAVANNKKDMEKVLSRTPMGRVGDPYEIGQICTFLASDAASYITGQVIYADGGRMALNYTVPTKD